MFHKMVDTQKVRQTSMDRVRERADSLRELDLDDVGKGLEPDSSSSMRLSNRNEEDDIAIAEAIADIEKEIQAKEAKVLPIGALIVAALAWLFRKELEPYLEWLLQEIGVKK